MCEHCGTGPTCAVCRRGLELTAEEFDALAARLAAERTPEAIAKRKAERIKRNREAFRRDIARRRL